MTSPRARHAPATERNRDPILAVLRRVLPAGGRVLEVASGTGEHAVYFARHLPVVVWQPSDIDPAAIDSIEAWRAAEGPANMLPPLAIDATSSDWTVTSTDAVVCINMVHIAPWRAAEGLFCGASRVLATGAPLVLYGPYRIEGRPTAPSNQAFDADLRARHAAWGLRTTGAMQQLGDRYGFEFRELVDMPANNCVLVFRRSVLPAGDDSGMLV